MRPSWCVQRRRAVAAGLLVLAACVPPVRQYEIRNERLTCEQANQYSYRTLQSMGFTITQFEPAVAGQSGTLRGTRDNRGTQKVTVRITCDGGNADIIASDDGAFLGQLEFKRGFFLAFSGTASQAAISESVARDEAQRPLEQKRTKGLQVLIEPVHGLGSKLDFDLDLAAGGVLPVRLTVVNASTRTYRLDPSDVALAQADGTRVRPLPVSVAAQRVADALRQKGSGSEAPAPDATQIAQRFGAQLFTAKTVTSNQTIKGYLFFPLGDYTKGRVSVEDEETEESEGFVVEF